MERCRRVEATMPASATAVPLQRLIEEQLVEVGFPAWPSPLWVARAVAPAAPRDWATQREAGAAAAFVAGAVGLPALVAVGAAVTTFALTSAVLLAPLLAVGLAWIAWRFNRLPEGGVAPGPTTPEAGGARAPR
jgi:hypothetical protein